MESMRTEDRAATRVGCIANALAGCRTRATRIDITVDSAEWRVSKKKSLGNGAARSDARTGCAEVKSGCAASLGRAEVPAAPHWVKSLAAFRTSIVDINY